MADTGRRGRNIGTPGTIFDKFLTNADTPDDLVDSDVDDTGLNITGDESIDDPISRLLDFLKESRDEQRAEEKAGIEAERTGLIDRIGGLSDRIGGLREDLIGGLKGRGEKFIEGFRGRQEAGLEDLRGILGSEREQAFSESAPEILEQLSGRGLLHSSGVGESLAAEQGRLQRGSESELARFGLAGRQAEEGLRQSLEDKISGIEQSGLGFETQLGTFGLGEESRLGDLDLGSLRELGRAGIGSLEELGTAGVGRLFSKEDIAADAELQERIARIMGKSNVEAAKFGAGTAALSSDPFQKLLGKIPGFNLIF